MRSIAFDGPGTKAQWFALFLLMASGVVFVRGALLAAPQNFLDFTGPYVESRAWLRKADPFDTAQAKRVMAEANDGRPRRMTALIYPPSAFPLLAPVALLNWPAAVAVWLVLSTALYFALVAALVFWAGLDRHRASAIGFVAATLAFGPARTGLELGQPGVFACTMTILAVFLATRNRAVMAGGLLGMAVGLKPQIGVLGLAYLLFTRRWKASLAATAIVALLWIAGVARLESISHNWPAEWRDRIAAVPLTYEPADPQRLLPIHLAVPLGELLGGGFPVQPLALAAVAIPGAYWVWLVATGRGRNDELLACGSFFALGMLATYHRTYDAILLMPLLAWAFRELSGDSRRIALTMLIVLTAFLVHLTVPLTLAASAGSIPESIAQSLLWRSFVLPYQVWATCVAAAIALWSLRRASVEPLTVRKPSPGPAGSGSRTDSPARGTMIFRESFT